MAFKKTTLIYIIQKLKKELQKNKNNYDYKNQMKKNNI